MKARTIVILLAALPAAWQVVRTAVVDYSIGQSPATAARFWPGHPQVAMKSGLTEMGLASAARHPVAPATIARVIDAAAKAPLAPEPYLVRGVQAQLAGQLPVAHAAFNTAKARDPRSVAARFFLASHLFVVGDVDRALAEVTDLARFVPGIRSAIAPNLADFARTPGGARKLKRALRDNPDIRTSLLTALSTNPANTDLIIYLAQGDEISTDWRTQLVQVLVAAGDYRRAYSIWSAGAPANQPPSYLFDPEFKEVGTASPPFGWTLTSDGNGLAERESGGLHIIHYGRQNSVLVAQTLLLEPGHYTLVTTVGDGAANAKILNWTLSCVGAGTRILTANLGQAGTQKNLSAAFEVPSTCPAQQLELAGVAPDFPQTADVSIADLSLTRSAQR